MVAVVGEYIEGRDGSYLRQERPKPGGCVRISVSRQFGVHILISVLLHV